MIIVFAASTGNTVVVLNGVTFAVNDDTRDFISDKVDDLIRDGSAIAYPTLSGILGWVAYLTPQGRIKLNL